MKPSATLVVLAAIAAAVVCAVTVAGNVHGGDEHIEAGKTKERLLQSPVLVSPQVEQALNVDTASEDGDEDDDGEDDDNDNTGSKDSTPTQPRVLATMPDEAFEATLAPFDVAVVLFTHVGCDTCTKFEQLLAEAFEGLPSDRVFMAKLNCSMHESECNRLHVVSLPQILMYKHAQPVGVFNASMAASKIVMYINKHLSHWPIVVETVADTLPTPWTTTSRGAIVVAVPSKDDPLVALMDPIVQSLIDTAPSFVLVGDDVAHQFGLDGPLPKVAVWNKKESQFFEYTGEIELHQFRLFANSHVLPLLDKRTYPETIYACTSVFQYHVLGIPIMLILTDDVAEFDRTYQSKILPVLREYRGRVAALQVDTVRHQRLQEQYGVTRLPNVVIETSRSQVFRLEDATDEPLGEASLRLFLKGYFDKTLKHKRKYEEVPDEPIRGLWILNTFNLEGALQEPTRVADMLVFYFAPNSESSREYASVIATVALVMRKVPKLVIGAYNLYMNEMPEEHNILALPSLAWYPKGETTPTWVTKPDAHSRMPTFDELKNWIIAHASDPIDVDLIDQDVNKAMEDDEAMHRARRQQHPRSGPPQKGKPRSHDQEPPNISKKKDKKSASPKRVADEL